MTEAPVIVIGSRTVGAGHPCYVIAEAGVNHNGRRDLAERLIDAAKDAGADAVKFQSFSAERLASPFANKAPYQSVAVPDGTQFEMLKGLELSVDDHRHLMSYARRRGIEFLSTPFDCQSATLLGELGVAAVKIGSGDLTDRFLLSCVAALRLPVLLSTGGATLAEVRSACHVVCEAGNPPLALLHCVSAYPASSDEVNLRALDVLRHTFNVPVGFSDHTPDILASIIAVARGSAILEKHLTLDRTLPGPDHAFSLEPEALRLLVNELRRTERALGDGAKQPSPAERPIMAVARKSMFAARRIERGAVITRDDLVALRPAGGMSPMDADCLIGALAVEAIEGGTLMRPDMVERARSRR